MPVLAIIGAGPGMGRAIARIFGQNGFTVALLSRTPENLNSIVRELESEGIKSGAFKGDVLDPESIRSGLSQVIEEFGSIDVLEHSPSAHGLELVSIEKLTPESLDSAFTFNVQSALAAVQTVLPGMRARKKGTILFTTGSTSVYPPLGNDMLANYAVTSAALRAYAGALHVALAPEAIQVGHVAIGVWIGQQPGTEPELIAPLHWELHTDPNESERLFVGPQQAEGSKAS